MTENALIRLAAPATLMAALIGIPADLYHFTIDGRAEVAGTFLFKLHGVGLVVAMALVVAALPGIALMLGDRLGAWGRAGLSMAYAGTVLVLADIAAEAFKMPMAPEALSDPTGYSLAVVVGSFALFALGWLVLGVVATRAKRLRVWQGALVYVGAVIGFLPVPGAYIVLLAAVAVMTRQLVRSQQPVPGPPVPVA